MDVRNAATDPVTDWATDFNILDPQYIDDPSPVWQQLRDRCPIAQTERFGRTLLPVAYADIAAIAHDTERFSSRDIAVITPGRDTNPHATTTVPTPPITFDPPAHTWARRLLLPRFSPPVIDDLVSQARALADHLIDGFVDDGRADLATAYAEHIPVQVIAQMIGVPREDEPMFTDWAVRLLQQGFHDLEPILGTVMEVIAYFEAKVNERAALDENLRPDDLLTLLVDARHDGEALSNEHRIGSCFLLLIAGIDTTWSAISASLCHLAANPDDQARLRADPDLMPAAVEEFLRFYSPVTMARYVTADTEVSGCPMHAGDKVLLSFPAANRDPAIFDDPDTFKIDRAQNRHLAFGSGVHRCLGSNLARMELRVALERFLARVPTFRLDDDSTVQWGGTQVRGPRRVPVVW